MKRRAKLFTALLPLLSACSHASITPTAMEIGICERLVSTYGVSRPGYVSEHEFAHASWERLLTQLHLEGADRVTEDQYVYSIPGASESAIKSLRFGFHIYDHGHKGYITETDEQLNERGRFRRGDRDHDGYWSFDECTHEPPAPAYFS